MVASQLVEPVISEQVVPVHVSRCPRRRGELTAAVAADEVVGVGGRRGAAVGGAAAALDRLRVEDRGRRGRARGRWGGRVARGRGRGAGDGDDGDDEDLGEVHFEWLLGLGWAWESEVLKIWRLGMKMRVL